MHVVYKDDSIIVIWQRIYHVLHNVKILKIKVKHFITYVALEKTQVTCLLPVVTLKVDRRCNHQHCVRQ